MFFLSKPMESEIRVFIEKQSRLELTYPEVSATAREPPSGYNVDRPHISLGTGRAAFEVARTALRRWEHFHLGWVEICWPNTPIEPGQGVAVLARFCGLWSLNACRVAYVVDEPRRFGFAYGTLPEHAESGEERFTVDWHDGDDSVWYDILAFSRPNQLLIQLGYPFVRKLQHRFARDSAAAMVRAVTEQA